MERAVRGLRLRLETPGWTEFATKGAMLALHSAEAPCGSATDPLKLPPAGCRPGLCVPDLYACHARMPEFGVTRVQEPTAVFGAWITQYLDPNALGISVSEQNRSG